ncbi:MAG: hypothetical protein HF962_05240 [Sulfurovum sp.]|nr:hypothetical protein [Sulfurovum sp.]
MIQKNKLIISMIIMVAMLIGLSGCVSTTPRCTSNTNASAYFCYQGYNFGENKTTQYRLGVKDGCKTANGRFTKNYKLSGSSTDYVKGWDKGRATCKLIRPKDAEPGTMRTEYQQSIDERVYYGN